MRDKITIYRLALRYWFQGDDWKDAVLFARAIVENFRKPKC